ncbi:MAG TPA: DUF2264 domain-containing protein [Ktedonosporobacter sp.]|nr:DUF2264 domain-containing protein [Ktedonosporobacter sp.]
MDTGHVDRIFWLEVMQRVAEPVLTALAARQLKKRMPVEARIVERVYFTHLEAVGRLLTGIAPWLEIPAEEEQEELQRRRYAELAREAIDAISDPSSPDYGNFSFVLPPLTGAARAAVDVGQPIVDAAFLSHAILRAPTELWEKLDARVQGNLVAALKAMRARKPNASNWLLFSAMIEATLFRLGVADWDSMRIDYALKQHEQWYLGDGIYGDGPEFHADYYNSFVIHPMLIDIIETVGQQYQDWSDLRERILRRAQRYAVILERSISPEGTFPVIGRSLAYRSGAFHLLAHMALRQELDHSLLPAQVRCALTAVIKRTLGAPGAFDQNGWLTIGLGGHQPELGEVYISTGSLYLCATVFLPLGLPAENTFWRDQADWTARKAWAGIEVPIDHAL